jgi:hypothetical protein
VEQVLDLDAAAALERRVSRWHSAGMTVGQLTWANGQTFDNNLTTDRSRMRGDYTVTHHARLRTGAQTASMMRTRPPR